MPVSALGRAVSWVFKHCSLAGVDLHGLRRSLHSLPGYLRERRAFVARLEQARDPMPLAAEYPCLHDRHAAGGSTATHYFHQDLHVARRIFAAHPQLHVDVGSRIDGFVAHVAVFRPITVLDIRPVAGDLPNITFRKADLMQPLPGELQAITDSLSCLHALEHFGLGRYGDPIDPDGHLKGLDNLHLALRPGGTLYLSVPIGPSRTEFNAHRVFSVAHVARLLRPRFRIVRFSYVDDAGAFHEDQPLDGQAATADFGCSFGCGIFEAVKL